MELDNLDLGGSWPLDQITFASNFRFPVIFSSSEQPFSPLWSFSEAASASGDGGGELCSGAPTRFTDYSVLLASSESETTKDNHLVPSPSWGLRPLENPDTYCAIKAKMTQALRYFKESSGQQHLLAQVWAPVKNRGRYVLTTSGQPFVLGPNSNGLNQYRMVSLTYMFSVYTVTMKGKRAVKDSDIDDCSDEEVETSVVLNNGSQVVLDKDPDESSGLGMVGSHKGEMTLVVIFRVTKSISVN